MIQKNTKVIYSKFNEKQKQYVAEVKTVAYLLDYIETRDKKQLIEFANKTIICELPDFISDKLISKLK